MRARRLFLLVKPGSSLLGRNFISLYLSFGNSRWQFGGHFSRKPFLGRGLDLLALWACDVFEVNCFVTLFFTTRRILDHSKPHSVIVQTPFGVFSSAVGLSNSSPLLSLPLSSKTGSHSSPRFQIQPLPPGSRTVTGEVYSFFFLSFYQCSVSFPLRRSRLSYGDAAKMSPACFVFCSSSSEPV